MNAVVEQPAALSPPLIGQAWPAQGGIFIGSRLIEGALHHIIIPGGVDQDTGELEFDQAGAAVAGLEINGHSDWRVPDKKDLLLAYINVPALFDSSSYYWSATPYGSSTAWAVDFADGSVYDWNRDNEFRVRPFRSIIASSI